MPRSRPLPVPAAPRHPSAAETLGPPPLIPGEERAGYEAMLARVTEAVRPTTSSRRPGCATSST